MNIVTAIEAHASTDRVALHHGDSSLSYRELAAMAQSVHAGLSAQGIGAGDRVMLMGGPAPEFVASLVGVLRAGAVAVPVNPLAPPPEMRAEIASIDPSLIVAGPAAADALAECAIDCALVGLPGPLATGAIAFEDFLAGGHPDLVEREPDDLALLLFTSGTAGAPKAAMLTHGNLQANIDQLDQHPADLGTADDVALGVLPLFHILGLNMLLGVILRTGASTVLVERFDPAETAELLQRFRVTVVSGPPAMWRAWAEMPGASPAAFRTVRLSISGAAALEREVAAMVSERLGVSLSQGYGLTEASPVLTLGAGTGAPPTSVGRPLPGVQLRLVGDNGIDVPVGDEGEVWARGDNIFPGYWNDPEATAAALTSDGWLRTGDIAVVDDDGFLYIVDRSKDLIVVSGFNVFPGEVEAALRGHDGIADAAVVGVAQGSSGEAVKAFVVPTPGTVIDGDEVIAYCETQLARYKTPQAVEVVAELPRGQVVGKLRRRDLR